MSRNFILTLFVVFISGVLTPAKAETSPEQLVMDVSQRVLETLNQYRPTYEDDPTILQGELLQLLDPVIDFESFSRGVMGEFHAQATPDQRSKFQTAFKATLVDLYTSALVASEITEMTLRETVMPSNTRARVVVNVLTSDGSSYVVQYNMKKDDTGNWKAGNIILDGINIGLTYRNQFKSAMETENQDISRVIEIWPELIDGA